MSKLEIIKESLEKDPEVIIAHMFERNQTPGSMMSVYTHIVNFMVAPTGGLFTAAEAAYKAAENEMMINFIRSNFQGKSSLLG